MPASIETFFQLYQDKFVVAYANLVALAVAKPKQTLIEESNILSHIAQCYNPSLSNEEKQKNLEKAFNHLERTIIDLNKLLWAELDEKLKPYVANEKYHLVFNLSPEKVLNQYKEFVQNAMEARKIEMTNIGNNPMKAVEFYEKVNEIGFTLYKTIDLQKINIAKRWKYTIKTKEFWFGVLASIIAWIIIEGSKYIYNNTSSVKPVIEQTSPYSSSNPAISAKPVPKDKTTAPK